MEDGLEHTPVRSDLLGLRDDTGSSAALRVAFIVGRCGAPLLSILRRRCCGAPVVLSLGERKGEREQRITACWLGHARESNLPIPFLPSHNHISAHIDGWCSI